MNQDPITAVIAQRAELIAKCDELEKHNRELRASRARMQEDRNSYKEQLATVEVELSELRAWRDSRSDDIKKLVSLTGSQVQQILTASKVAHERCSELAKEVAALTRWKEERLTVESWWKEVDDYVRRHSETVLGAVIAHQALRLLKERDAFEHQIAEFKQRWIVLDGKENYERVRQEDISYLRTQLKEAEELAPLPVSTSLPATSADQFEEWWASTWAPCGKSIDGYEAARQAWSASNILALRRPT